MLYFGAEIKRNQLSSKRTKIGLCTSSGFSDCPPSAGAHRTVCGVQSKCQKAANKIYLRHFDRVSIQQKIFLRYVI